LHSPTEIFERQYKAAAAEGAIVELKIRLLADKVPQLQQFAHNKTLSNVETLITKHFAASLSEEEARTLDLCRVLRNKILHCDFRAAREKLEQLGITTPRGRVRMTDIQGLFGPETIERIAGVAANRPGTFQNVSDLAFSPGTVLGWLIELGVAGDFTGAADCFVRAAAILDRLAMID
jgi:hypothetical protein